MLKVFEPGEVEVERVCKADTCKNRFFTIETGRGGRTKEYCQDSCKKQASRKGKAYSAHGKAYLLEQESRKLMIEANRLMEKASELMRQSDLAIVVKGVALREAEYEANKNLKVNA